MTTKLLYILNVIGQLICLNFFLSSKQFIFGLEFIHDLVSSKNFWESSRFPRVTMCDFTIRTLGENNHQNSIQCTLPINLFNENIFIFIDKMYSQLISSIKSAYINCSRVVSCDHVIKNKSWFTKDLYRLKNDMLSIRYKSIQTIEDLNDLKRLKKCFKNMMKKNLFLYEMNQYFKIGNLIKAKSGENFFKIVNSFLNKDKKIELQMDQVVTHYYQIFNETLNINFFELTEAVW